MSRNLRSSRVKLAKDVVSEYFPAKKPKLAVSNDALNKFKKKKFNIQSIPKSNEEAAYSQIGNKSQEFIKPVPVPEEIERKTRENTSGKIKKATLTDIEDLRQPAKWEEVLNGIREMRSGRDAPVDSMGCDQCADPSSSKPTQRLHHLLSLMLSSQTKDQVTFAAMARLRDIPGGLNIETILELPEDDLGRLIIPVGFWKTKAKHIKATCQILKDQYKGDIPDTVEGLCKLPGVGPKMAHLCMQSAWGVVSGIGVDTHVHRISNRLGWVRKTKTPEKTRTELEAWLPHSLWREVNHLLVGLGQTICKPVKPNCSECLINKLCPSAGKG